MFENMRYGVKSDVGLRRHDNEDYSLIVGSSGNSHNLQQLGVAFVIADGIGGHAAGEIASRMACEEVIAAYYRDDVSYQECADTHKGKAWKLEQAVRSAHHRIIHWATEKDEWRGMGTTLSALVLTENKALIAHVGDSRIYRLRNNKSERLTIDHTQSQDLIDRGQILPDDENNLCYGYILTQALGGYDDLETVYTRIEDLREGDAFLLCTDGLHDFVTDSEIQAILVNNSLTQDICDALVQAALGKGGHDNITVVFIQL